MKYLKIWSTQTNTRMITALILLLCAMIFWWMPIAITLSAGLLVLLYVMCIEWPQFHIWWLTPWYPILPWICSMSMYRQYPWTVAWIVMVCAATDTAGYAAGKKYGTHAGIFPWSPNKTPQGLIAAWLTGTFVGYLTISWLPTTLVKYPILFSGGAALLAIVGDSIQSILKRNAHIKDAGTLLPGHGGILDRVDSILMVGIAMYLAIRIKLL